MRYSCDVLELKCHGRFATELLTFIATRRKLVNFFFLHSINSYILRQLTPTSSGRQNQWQKYLKNFYTAIEKTDPIGLVLSSQ